MFESFSNVIFILVALVVFIGRIILQAKKKPEPGPRIPVHFEDEESGDEGFDAYVQTRGASAYIKRAAAEKQSAPLVEARTEPLSVSMEVRPLAEDPFSPEAAPARPPKKTKESGAPSPAREAAFNLGYLSPLKQAVAMAEILGPPKGLL